MYRQTAVNEEHRQIVRPLIAAAPDSARLARLTNDDVREVLAFLKVRPVHTVVMTSFITDNGLESDLNRGEFFGYRSRSGELEGVALIGHSTLVEARSSEALHALAIQARSARTPIHLIMSSGDDADRFWGFMGMAEAPRLTCTEALFEVKFPFAVPQEAPRLRKADMGWLLPVARAQAEVAFAESGVDPMAVDRVGFLKRVARRIEQGRVHIVTDGNKLVFKADIIAETDDTIYIEGVYVSEEFRGRGLGSKCLSSLTLELLERVENVSMLSNIDFEAAHRSFVNAGYKKTDECTTLFV